MSSFQENVMGKTLETLIKYGLRWVSLNRYNERAQSQHPQRIEKVEYTLESSKVDADYDELTGDIKIYLRTLSNDCYLMNGLYPESLAWRLLSRRC